MLTLQRKIIFNWLKNLTTHFVHMEPFNIFALFTWNIEWLDVLIFEQLRWFHVNRTTKKQIFNQLKICPAPCGRSLSSPFPSLRVNISREGAWVPAEG